MDKKGIIHIIENYYSGKFKEEEVIMHYCLMNGKNQVDIKKFLAFTSFLPGLNKSLCEYIMDKYTSEYEICIITDKNNNFIKAY